MEGPMSAGTPGKPGKAVTTAVAAGTTAEGTKLTQAQQLTLRQPQKEQERQEKVTLQK